MVIKVFLICGAMLFVGWRIGKWLKKIADKHFKDLERIDYDLKKYVNEQKEKRGDNDDN